MLCAGDVQAVALLIRKQVKDELALLEKDLAEFNERRSDCATNQRLFCWNSWHKPGSNMCRADFGEDMLEFEWLNLFNFVDPTTVLVNASTAKVDSEFRANRDDCLRARLPTCAIFNLLRRAGDGRVTCHLRGVTSAL